MDSCIYNHNDKWLSYYLRPIKYSSTPEDEMAICFDDPDRVEIEDGCIDRLTCGLLFEQSLVVGIY